MASPTQKEINQFFKAAKENNLPKLKELLGLECRSMCEIWTK